MRTLVHAELFRSKCWKGWGAALISVPILLACQKAPQPAARSIVEAAAPANEAVEVPAGPSSQIDAMIRADWAKDGVVPVALADDARFLRRVYIDTVGTIPPPEVVTTFLADPAPDKRKKMVDILLASPAYAEHWATYWTNVLIGLAPAQEVDRGAFERWLVGRLNANAPWNELVTELLTAQGQNGEGGPRGPGGLGRAAASDEPSAGAGSSSIHPAVNWFIKYRETPQDLAGSASRVFLGVQIQCAQCHDHKTEKWKQDDFRSFASCFMRTRVEVLDKGPAMGEVKRATVFDIGRPLPRYAKNPELSPFASAAPKALDGTDLSRSADARQALAAWVTSAQNPWFAQAIVNRMWAHYLGRGFIDPIDDIRPSNPVTAPEVLAKLSSDFQEHGYDLKRLVRTITQTEVYQLSSAARAPAGSPSAGSAKAAPAVAATSTQPEKLWSRFRLEPLGPEELLNALMDATGVEGALRRTRANVDRIMAILFNAYSFLFDVDEEFDQTDFEGTVSQALALLNGRLVGGGTSGLPGSALDNILRAPGSDTQKLTELFLRTLSRPPSPEELGYFTSYVNGSYADPAPSSGAPPGVAGPAAIASSPASPTPAARPWAPKPLGRGQGKRRKGQSGGEPEPLERLAERDANNANPKRRAYEDVFWELLNSSEFTFNH
jgi:hypothetical protein